MHYAFESVEKVRIMLQNVGKWLRVGGVFVGTVPNDELLLSVAFHFLHFSVNVETPFVDRDWMKCHLILRMTNWRLGMKFIVYGLIRPRRIRDRYLDIGIGSSLRMLWRMYQSISFVGIISSSTSLRPLIQLPS